MIPALGSGWLTLLYKELLRFWKVSFQTVAAPVLTALLYLLIFSHVLESHVSVFDGRVGYTAFLIPGLVMMHEHLYYTAGFSTTSSASAASPSDCSNRHSDGSSPLVPGLALRGRRRGVTRFAM